MLTRRAILLFALAALPTLIAGALDRDDSQGKSGERITINSASPDQEIRSKLLEGAPLGTDAVDVLSFVVDKLQPARPINAYSKYVRAYKESKGRDSGAMRITSRFIAVIVAERPVSLLSSERVWAKWHFDDKDRLTDITIERVAIGP